MLNRLEVIFSIFISWQYVWNLWLSAFIGFVVVLPLTYPFCTDGAILWANYGVWYEVLNLSWASCCMTCWVIGKVGCWTKYTWVHPVGGWAVCVTEALGDCCDGGCPLVIWPWPCPPGVCRAWSCPLLLAELEDLGLVLHMIYKYFPLFLLM